MFKKLKESILVELLFLLVVVIFLFSINLISLAQIKNDISFKKNQNIEKAKQQVIKEIKKDKTYGNVFEIINNYRNYKKKDLN